MKKLLRNKKGITLIALVITIIVLIILAGVSFSLLLGENGIITKTREGKTNYELAANEENVYLKDVEDYLVAQIEGGTPTVKIPKVTIKSTMEEVEVTSSNISSLIGTEIVYNPEGDQDGSGNPKGTWRIFYLDTTDKYGDGVNTLYIKRDNDANVKFLDSDYASYTTDVTNAAEVTKIAKYMKKMNPLWGTKDGTLSQANEYESAYLCNPENWNATYLDSSVANYAVGTPSVEMYIDAYNQWGEYAEGKGPQCYKIDNNETGYKVGVNENYQVQFFSLDSGTNNVFLAPNISSWLASPCYNSELLLLNIDRYIGVDVSDNRCINPIVSLK